GLSKRPTARSANGGYACERTVTLLLEVSKSGSPEVMVAVEERAPAVVGVTITVAVAVAPTVKLPSAPVTVPPAWEMEPWEMVAETNTTPLGSVWLMTAFLAVLGPKFETVML